MLLPRFGRQWLERFVDGKDYGSPTRRSPVPAGSGLANRGTEPPFCSRWGLLLKRSHTGDNPRQTECTDRRSSPLLHQLAQQHDVADTELGALVLGRFQFLLGILQAEGDGRTVRLLGMEFDRDRVDFRGGKIVGQR